MTIGDDSNAVTGADQLTIRCYLHLADSAFCLHDLAAAAEVLEKALGEAHRARAGAQEVAIILNRLGVVYCCQDRPVEAERLFKRAIALLERNQETCRPELAIVLSNLARGYAFIGLMEEARPVCERVIAMLEPDTSAGLDLARMLDVLADIQVEAREFPAAWFSLKRALAIKEAVLGRGDWDVAVTLKRMGRFYFKQARYNEAEPHLRRALEIFMNIVGPSDPSLCRLYAVLAQLYAQQGKSQLAEPLLVTGLRLAETIKAPDHPDIISMLRRLSEAYRHSGRLSESEAAWNLALKILDGPDEEKRSRLRVRRDLLRFSGEAFDSMEAWPEPPSPPDSAEAQSAGTAE